MLRIFSEDVAREFYLGFLGFHAEWEHRYDRDAPLYMQVARAGLTLHLSEHHGDATPGSTVFVTMHGVEDFHDDPVSKHYRYQRPGIEPMPWGRVMEVSDPFGNRIRFCERVGSHSA